MGTFYPEIGVSRVLGWRHEKNLHSHDMTRDNKKENWCKVSSTVPATHYVPCMLSTIILYIEKEKPGISIEVIY